MEGRIKTGRISFFDIGDKIEYMCEFGKIKIADCIEVSINKNEYQTNIWYRAINEIGDEISIDGESFKEL